MGKGKQRVSKLHFTQLGEQLIKKGELTVGGIVQARYVRLQIGQAIKLSHSIILIDF